MAHTFRVLSVFRRSGPFAHRNARLYVFFTVLYNARAYYPVLAIFFTDLGLTLERDHGNARLDIDVRLTNPNARRLLLVAPAVRLLNAKGAEVPAFILPVEPPPELPPSTEATAKLRFWLEQEDLAGKLTLELVGTTLEVKPDKAFDLESLKNAEPKKQPW